MVNQEVIVINKLGLHARPAALFVQTANKFASDIMIEKGTKKINAKSIMGVMSLGVGKGEKIVIQVDGPDESEALSALVHLVEVTLADM
ncbi:phosphocarrier protein [Geosporobacter subterraneus DSM 17957]|uniref:Phosphocarrier protein HPr n=1 Tax=Geosporobacter subterraneus DSM 17957 TaxID=1121919 RepID=A0A1M6JCN3_9FIRM|nr:HPr family phosphocarrier protein [Geosporobacter subterraneus]SHJ44433.1 phosphocarrier protein [Geosporobacter subterraneus DSM 17957]